MKIIGSNHDYYDSALRHGQSSTIHFVRKTECFETRLRDSHGEAVIAQYGFMYQGMPSIRDSGRTKNGQVVLKPFCVAFCGKLYPGIEVTYWAVGRGMYYYGEPSQHEFFYDSEALAKFLEDRGFREENSRGNTFGSGAEVYLKAPKPDHMQFFVDRREPIVTARLESYGEKTVTRNDMLKSVEFFKVFDAWQAFQELEMFLGGIAAPESKPMAVIEDKFRIAQRGFDRYSFRKAPTKKRA